MKIEYDFRIIFSTLYKVEFCIRKNVSYAYFGALFCCNPRETFVAALLQLIRKRNIRSKVSALFAFAR